MNMTAASSSPVRIKVYTPKCANEGLPWVSKPKVLAMDEAGAAAAAYLGGDEGAHQCAARPSIA
jgi:hypothetical protein